MDKVLPWSGQPSDRGRLYNCTELSSMRGRGVVLKKRWGTPETRLKDFFNNLCLHTCCTEIILHCVSVSNQLQQCFARIIQSKKVEGVGDASPCRKKWGTPSPPRSRPTTALTRTRWLRSSMLSLTREWITVTPSWPVHQGQ